MLTLDTTPVCQFHCHWWQLYILHTGLERTVPMVRASLPIKSNFLLINHWLLIIVILCPDIWNESGMFLWQLQVGHYLMHHIQCLQWNPNVCASVGRDINEITWIARDTTTGKIHFERWPFEVFSFVHQRLLTSWQKAFPWKTLTFCLCVFQVP